MRHVILLDNKITNFDEWKEEDRAFWEYWLGVIPTYEVIKTDYSDYPTYKDEDGDIRPTHAYLKSLTDTVVSKYGDFGTDFIMVMIHEDNWKSDLTPDIKGDGIWGTSYSYKFGKQHLEYCRWDKDNMANTFGTAFHERMHPVDALVKVELGIDINPIMEAHLETTYSSDTQVISYLNANGFQWDRDVVHGKMKPPFMYIRSKENADILPVVAPYMKQAFLRRKELHQQVIDGYKKTVVELMYQVIRLLREKLNQKNGVPRS